MASRWGLFATITILAATLAPSLTAAGPDTTLVLAEICLPQLPACEAPSAACGFRAPPGGFINVSVRALREGQPQPLTRLVLEPGGDRALTDRAGMARFSIPPSDGTVEYTIATEGQTPAVHLTLTWTAATVLVEAAPSVAIIGTEDSIRFRVLASTDGSPLEGASVLLAGSDGDVTSTDPADANGTAVFPLAFHGPYEERYRIVDLDACGLPLASALGTLNLTWSTSSATLAHPSIRLPSSEWLRSNVVPYILAGGEPPVRVEWRMTRGTEWQHGMIVLPDGPHEITVRAVDARGRVGTASAALRIDASGPSIYRPYVSPGTPCEAVTFQVVDNYSGLVPSSFTITDRGVHLPVVLDEEGVLRLQLDSGVHTLVATARDRAGNPGATSLHVQCDSTPPRAEALWAGNEWIRCDAVAWRILEDPRELDPASVRVSVGGAPIEAALDGTLVAPRVPEGRHILTLNIQDAVGNLLDRSDEVLCDAAPPTLAPVPRGRIVHGFLVTPASLDSRAADSASGIATVRARIDGGEWTTADAIIIEGEGTRTIEVEVTDGVGRMANATLVQRVDTLPPMLEVPAGILAGSWLVGTVTDGASGFENLKAILPDGTARAIDVQPDGSFAFKVPAGGASRILLTAGDRVGNDAGVVVRIDAQPAALPTTPAASTPVPQDAAGSLADRAEVVYRLQAVAVTPLELKLPEEVQVSGLAEGIRGGRAFLVDEAGLEHDLGPVEVVGRNFTASGRPSAPGAYIVKIRFETAAGDVILHEAGTIHVASVPPPRGQHAAASEMPGPGLLFVVAVLVLAGFAFRRPKP